MRRVLYLLMIVFLLYTGRAAADTMFVADLHLTANAADHAQVLDAIAESARGRDTLVFLGDNTNNGRSEEHTAFLTFLARLEKETGARILVVPGNHDLCGETTPEVFRARYARYGAGQAAYADQGSLSYAVVHDVCYLVVDTNAYDAVQRMTGHGGISEGTLAFCESVLAALPEDVPVVACGHYPLLPLGEGRDGADEAGELLGCLRRHGVGLWMCGHRHNNETLSGYGLRQITVGVPGGYPAWCGLLVEGSPWTYRVLPLFDEDSAYAREGREAALQLGRTMAEGSLKGTAYEGDEGAVAWFADAFLCEVESRVKGERERLLADENCEKWRRASVRAVTREWILGILDGETEDVREITVDMNRKKQ